MQRTVYRHIIADTLAPSGADLTVLQDVLYVNGVKIATLRDVRNQGAESIPAVTSETAGVVTFTVASATPAYSTTYGIYVIQANPNAQGADPNPIVKYYAVTTPATGTLTPTTVDAQLLALINADSSKHFTAAGGATLVLTAAAGYPILTGGWQQNPDSSTVAQTTVGIQKQGTLAQMYSLGVATTGNPATPPANFSNTIWASGTAGTLADTAYDAFYFESFENIGENNTLRAAQGNQTVLWIGHSASNRAAFVSILTAILGGFLRNGTSVSYKQLETIPYNTTQ